MRSGGGRGEEGTQTEGIVRELVIVIVIVIISESDSSDMHCDLRIKFFDR